MLLFYSSYVVAAKLMNVLKNYQDLVDSGEYETYTYTRDGDVFMMQGIYELFIAKDTEEILMLISMLIQAVIFFLIR